jgi:hypothetical protein
LAFGDKGVYYDDDGWHVVVRSAPVCECPLMLNCTINRKCAFGYVCGYCVDGGSMPKRVGGCCALAAVLIFLQ